MSKTKKLFQNKFLLKSIQVFLVCLVVLGGGFYVNSEVEAKTYEVVANCAMASQNACCGCRSRGRDISWPSPNVPNCPSGFKEFHYADRDTPNPALIPADYDPISSDPWVSSTDLSYTHTCLRVGDTITFSLYDDDGNEIASASKTNKNVRTTMDCIYFSCGYRICSELTPTCDSFTATPASIILGESSNLKWETTDATSVTIDDGGGAVNKALDNPTIGEDVFPLLTTTYTLTAANASGDTDTCTATVTVCVPKSCADYPGQCGAALDDGCGGTIDCSGACGAQICCWDNCQDPVCSNDGDCDDGDVCTTNTCKNAGTCAASCSKTGVGCVPGDGCCLIGCTNPPDTDCAPPSGHGKYFKYNKDIVLVFTEGAEFLLRIAGGLALLMIIFGGVYYMVCGSNPDGQTKAKKIVTYAVIGLAIVLISYVIITAVESFAV